TGGGTGGPRFAGAARHWDRVRSCSRRSRWSWSAAPRPTRVPRARPREQGWRQRRMGPGVARSTRACGSARARGWRGLRPSILAAAQLDQLHLVPVRILDERGRPSAMLQRTGLARHLGALGAQSLDRLVDAVDAQRHVAVGSAEIVCVGVPVVGELEDRLLILRTISDERQRESARRVVLLPE